MYTLKDNKLPKFHLRFNKYEIKSQNERVIEYRKRIIEKDEFNYGKFYFIHIFYHLKDKNTEVCVSLQKYDREMEDWRYDWYSGDYEDKSLFIIGRYDKKLLNYIEKIEDLGGNND